jgi:hypothetical protein
MCLRGRVRGGWVGAQSCDSLDKRRMAAFVVPGAHEPLLGMYGIAAGLAGRFRRTMRSAEDPCP